MGDIVNLNRLRKRRAREDDKRRAAENVVRHGRTKAQKLLEEARARKAREDHDGIRLEDR